MAGYLTPIGDLIGNFTNTSKSVKIASMPKECSVASQIDPVKRTLQVRGFVHELSRGEVLELI